MENEKECIVYNGVKFHPFVKGFYRGKYKHESVVLHRFVYESCKGKLPPDYVVYHIDGNTENNRISNLAAIPKREFLAQKARSRAGKVKEKHQWIAKNDAKYIEYLETQTKKLFDVCFRFADILEHQGFSIGQIRILREQNKKFERKKLDRMKKVVDNSP